LIEPNKFEWGKITEIQLIDFGFQTTLIVPVIVLTGAVFSHRLAWYYTGGVVMVLAGVVYPLIGRLHWGQGWLSDLGFHDFSGGMLVYGLAGAIILGFIVRRTLEDTGPITARWKRWMYLGIYLLVFGWQFSATLAMSDGELPMHVVGVMAAASVGGVISCLVSSLMERRLDFRLVIHGLFAGSIAVSGMPDLITIPAAILLAGLAGAFVVLVKAVLQHLRIYDPFDACATLLLPGILSVTYPWTIPEASISFGAQFFGMSIIFWGGLLFGFLASLLPKKC
ncbi:MAG: hypothetical protein AAF226_02125, partial [Verrucomicrobiota bacterium]